ncbi:fibronectin type III domain-containing protein, partial [Patescibacteria group bacterium]|nr:fibronectin type III domain-containing protein [Patescibacteria group bacterium]
KATITWSTSRTSDSKVQYGTTSGSYGDVEPSNSSQVTSHSIQLTGLTPGTTYYYKAKWTDEDGNTGTSDEKSFSTSPAPTVHDVSAKSVGLTTSTIEYTAKGASKVKIYYGKTTDFGAVKEVSTSISETTYTTELTGLDDGTKYYYKINTYDSESDEYEGTVLDFTTLPRPKISSVRIQQVSGAAQPTALITWQSNTEVSSIVTYYPENNSSEARDEVNVELIKGAHKMIVRGLKPQTPYILVVKGRDKIGNEAVSDSQKFTTATDTRPPIITDLRVEGTAIPQTASTAQESTGQIVVTWNTDEPATGQVEFGEGTGSSYSQRTQEDSNLTYNHVVVISNLATSKVYHLRAISNDSVGNDGYSVDTVTITPKATANALNLVISGLQQAFGFLGGLKQ